MASFSNNIFCYFFLVMLFLSSLTQARESKFFSKFTHFSTTTKNGVKLSPSPSAIDAPAPAQIFELAPAPAPAEVHGEIGYGVRDQRSDRFSNTPAKKSSTNSLGENELFDEEFYGESYEKEYRNSNKNNNNYDEHKLASESHETANEHNYNGYTGNYNTNNGYELASGNYKTSKGENKNRYYTGNYNAKGYENNQRQGMSDTRFVENGKYYYNSANGYETGKLSGQNNGYYGNYENQNQGYYHGNSENINQGYYGNSENQNEFKNREYENQELYDEDSQEEFLP